MWKRDRKGYVVLCWREPGSRTIHTKPEHVAVWEAANGLVPDGYIVHHIDGITDHNAPENLDCIPRADHPLRHTPNVRTCYGVAERRCGICEEWKPVDAYYRRGRGRQRYCKVCAGERRQQWAVDNRERLNAYMREYRRT